MGELGIDPEELGGSPIKAAGSSFLGFTVGAFIPLLPWICTQDSETAFYVTLGLCAFVVIALGLMTAWILGLAKNRWALITIRQLVVVVVAAALVIGCNNGISRLVKGDTA